MNIERFSFAGTPLFFFFPLLYLFAELALGSADAKKLKMLTCSGVIARVAWLGTEQNVDILHFCVFNL